MFLILLCRFAVNFLSHSGDIVFHLCPRFRENCVVRNNVQNMNWGPEERSGSMPIYPGQSFEVIIMCDQYNYKVNIIVNLQLFQCQ